MAASAKSIDKMVNIFEAWRSKRHLVVGEVEELLDELCAIEGNASFRATVQELRRVYKMKFSVGRGGAG